MAHHCKDMYSSMSENCCSDPTTSRVLKDLPSGLNDDYNDNNDGESDCNCHEFYQATTEYLNPDDDMYNNNNNNNNNNSNSNSSNNNNKNNNNNNNDKNCDNCMNYDNCDCMEYKPFDFCNIDDGGREPNRRFIVPDLATEWYRTQKRNEYPCCFSCSLSTDNDDWDDCDCLLECRSNIFCSCDDTEDDDDSSTNEIICECTMSDSECAKKNSNNNDNSDSKNNFNNKSMIGCLCGAKELGGTTTLNTKTPFPCSEKRHVLDPCKFKRISPEFFELLKAYEEAMMAKYPNYCNCHIYGDEDDQSHVDKASCDCNESIGGTDDAAAVDKAAMSFCECDMTSACPGKMVCRSKDQHCHHNDNGEYCVGKNSKDVSCQCAASQESVDCPICNMNTGTANAAGICALTNVLDKIMKRKEEEEHMRQRQCAAGSEFSIVAVDTLSTAIGATAGGAAAAAAESPSENLTSSYHATTVLAKATATTLSQQGWFDSVNRKCRCCVDMGRSLLSNFSSNHHQYGFLPNRMHNMPTRCCHMMQPQHQQQCQLQNEEDDIFGCREAASDTTLKAKCTDSRDCIKFGNPKSVRTINDCVIYQVPYSEIPDSNNEDQFLKLRYPCGHCTQPEPNTGKSTRPMVALKHQQHKRKGCSNNRISSTFVRNNALCKTKMSNNQKKTQRSSASCCCQIPNKQQPQPRALCVKQQSCTCDCASKPKICHQSFSTGHLPQARIQQQMSQNTACCEQQQEQQEVQEEQQQQYHNSHYQPCVQYCQLLSKRFPDKLPKSHNAYDNQNIEQEDQLSSIRIDHKQQQQQQQQQQQKYEQQQQFNNTAITVSDQLQLNSSSCLMPPQLRSSTVSTYQQQSREHHSQNEYCHHQQQQQRQQQQIPQSSSNQYEHYPHDHYTRHIPEEQYLQNTAPQFQQRSHHHSQSQMSETSIKRSHQQSSYEQDQEQQGSSSNYQSETSYHQRQPHQQVHLQSAQCVELPGQVQQHIQQSVNQQICQYQDTHPQLKSYSDQHSNLHSHSQSNKYTDQYHQQHQEQQQYHQQHHQQRQKERHHQQEQHHQHQQQEQHHQHQQQQQQQQERDAIEKEKYTKQIHQSTIIESHQAPYQHSILKQPTAVKHCIDDQPQRLLPHEHQQQIVQNSQLRTPTEQLTQAPPKRVVIDVDESTNKQKSNQYQQQHQQQQQQHHHHQHQQQQKQSQSLESSQQLNPKQKQQQQQAEMHQSKPVRESPPLYYRSRRYGVKVDEKAYRQHEALKSCECLSAAHLLTPWVVNAGPISLKFPKQKDAACMTETIITEPKKPTMKKKDLADPNKESQSHSVYGYCPSKKTVTIGSVTVSTGFPSIPSELSTDLSTEATKSTEIPLKPISSDLSTSTLAPVESSMPTLTAGIPPAPPPRKTTTFTQEQPATSTHSNSNAAATSKTNSITLLSQESFPSNATQIYATEPSKSMAIKPQQSTTATSTSTSKHTTITTTKSNELTIEATSLPSKSAGTIGTSTRTSKQSIIKQAKSIPTRTINTNTSSEYFIEQPYVTRSKPSLMKTESINLPNKPVYVQLLNNDANQPQTIDYRDERASMMSVKIPRQASSMSHHSNCNVTGGSRSRRFVSTDDLMITLPKCVSRMQQQPSLSATSTKAADMATVVITRKAAKMQQYFSQLQQQKQEREQQQQMSMQRMWEHEQQQQQYQQQQYQQQQFKYSQPRWQEQQLQQRQQPTSVTILKKNSSAITTTTATTKRKSVHGFNVIPSTISTNAANTPIKRKSVQQQQQQQSAKKSLTATSRAKASSQTVQRMPKIPLTENWNQLNYSPAHSSTMYASTTTANKRANRSRSLINGNNSKQQQLKQQQQVKHQQQQQQQQQQQHRFSPHPIYTGNSRQQLSSTMNANRKNLNYSAHGLYAQNYQLTTSGSEPNSVNGVGRTASFKAVNRPNHLQSNVCFGTRKSQQSTKQNNYVYSNNNSHTNSNNNGNRKSIGANTSTAKSRLARHQQQCDEFWKTFLINCAQTAPSTSRGRSSNKSGSGSGSGGGGGATTHNTNTATNSTVNKRRKKINSSNGTTTKKTLNRSAK